MRHPYMTDTPFLRLIVRRPLESTLPPPRPAAGVSAREVNRDLTFNTGAVAVPPAATGPGASP